MIKFRTTHYHCTWVTTLKYYFEMHWKVRAFFQESKGMYSQRGTLLIQFEAIKWPSTCTRNLVAKDMFWFNKIFSVLFTKISNKVVESVLLISFSCTFDRNFTLIFMLLALMCLLSTFQIVHG